MVDNSCGVGSGVLSGPPELLFLNVFEGAEFLRPCLSSKRDRINAESQRGAVSR